MSAWRSVLALLLAACLGCSQGGDAARRQEVRLGAAPTAISRPTLPPPDLREVRRAIRKEPAYPSKAPRYGLLVFGPRAETRVWLVLDGERLYADRNGNGDLTEEGECIDRNATPDGGNLPADFAVGDIPAGDGETVYRGVAVQVIEEDGEPMAFVFARHAGRRFFTGRDASGRLRFGDTARAAPVVHIGGPLCMGLATRERAVPVRFVRGAVTELCAAVGTPGLGKGTFLGLRYADAPEGRHPVAEIEFPGASPDGPPVGVRVVLTGRC